MWSLGVLCWFLVGLLRGVKSANILILHPVYSGSHHIIMRNFGDHLVSRGHNVTQVKFKMINTNLSPDTKVNVIDLPIQSDAGGCQYINERGEMDIASTLAESLWKAGKSLTFLPTDVFCLTRAHCHTLFNDRGLNHFLNVSHFDLAIVDLIANECGLALANSLEIPVAAFWFFSPQGGEMAFTPTLNNPAYVPAFFSGLGAKMNFVERVFNFGLHVVHYALLLFQENITQGLISQRFPHLPPVRQMVHDIQLYLLNSNFFVTTPRLLTPNMKYIGGLHLRDGYSLPEKYENFMSNATHGVILFSLGYTGFSASAIPAQTIEQFLLAFSRMKQRVIMRFDLEYIPFVPDNVMVDNWVPQQDILAHPKTVAFLSHCGMFGTMESLYHRVPIIGIPIFSDQIENAQYLVDSGLGVQILNKDQVTANTIMTQCQKVLRNSSIYQRVNHYANIWRDRPLSPVEEATYWIEHLLRHRDLSHLRIRDDHLNMLQYFCLDIIAFFLFIILALSWALWKALQHWTRLRPRSPRTRKLTMRRKIWMKRD